MTGSQDTVLVITPGASTWRSILADLLAHRELLFFLAWRDIKIRYRQTAIGVLWVLLQPLLTALILTAVLGRFIARDTPFRTYVWFVLCGVVPWQLFSYALLNSSNRLVDNANLITKVYFPRILLPLSSILSGLIDFVAGLALLALGFWLGPMAFTWKLLFLPLFATLALLCAFAVGTWFSALNVRYHDVKYAVPFLTQLWFFATPISYPLQSVPTEHRWLLLLNPMTAVTEGFHWALFSDMSLDRSVLIVSTSITLVVLVSGILYFRNTERTFADII